MDNPVYTKELEELLRYSRLSEVLLAYSANDALVTRLSADVGNSIILGRYGLAALAINLIFAAGYRMGKDGLLDKDVWANAIDEAFMKENELCPRLG
jgi:hypothetical protein